MFDCKPQATKILMIIHGVNSCFYILKKLKNMKQKKNRICMQVSVDLCACCMRISRQTNLCK